MCEMTQYFNYFGTEEILENHRKNVNTMKQNIARFCKKKMFIVSNSHNDSKEPNETNQTSDSVHFISITKEINHSVWDRYNRSHNQNEYNFFVSHILKSGLLKHLWICCDYFIF